MRTALTLSLAVLIASPIFAQDEKKKRKKQGQRGQATHLSRVFSLPGIELGEDQKEKVAELKKEYGPKLKEVQQKLDSILTEEQQQAKQKASNDARAAGKQGQGLREKVEAALNLSGEQRKQMKTIQREQRQLMGKIREELMALMTDEQKAEIEKRKAERGQKRKKKVSK